jgi:hypothetical protein
VTIKSEKAHTPAITISLFHRRINGFPPWFQFTALPIKTRTADRQYADRNQCRQAPAPASYRNMQTLQGANKSTITATSVKILAAALK